MKRWIFPIVLLAAAWLSSCGGHTEQARLAGAREMIQTGEYVLCSNICGSLVEDTLDLTVEELGELSILLMKLDEQSDHDSEAISAVKCYRRAWRVSPEVARDYYSQLNVDDERYAATLALIAGARDTIMVKDTI